MRGVDHLHKPGRVLAQGTPEITSFFQKLRQRSGFDENVCLSMKEENHEVSMLYSLGLWFND